MTRKGMVTAGLAMAAAVVVMTGCGNNTASNATTAAGTGAAAQTETVVTDKMNDEAFVELGEYKGLNHTKVKDEVTDGEVEAYIQSLAVEYPPEQTDRVAKEGDTANIDYEGKKDGVAFSGGTSYGYDLELGSGEFIAGFEDAVIGMMPGEEKDIPLTFPEDYHNEELAGVDVVFHVKLNHVTNPEEIAIDDELAKRVTYNKITTLEDLRADCRQKLEINAEVYYYLESAAELLTQVVANSEITIDPDAAEDRVNAFVTQYASRAGLYGMDYKSFLAAFMNTTPEQAEADVLNALREEMVMNEILKLENIQATDEQKLLVAKINGCENAEKLVERYGEEQAETMYGMYAGVHFLIENAAQ